MEWDYKCVRASTVKSAVSDGNESGHMQISNYMLPIFAAVI